MKSQPFKKVTTLIVLGLWYAALLSAQGTSHIVARGDTLYSIARQYGVEVSSLEKANNINDPTKLHLGQKLSIPGAKKDTTVQNSTENSSSDFEKYTVKKGDTFYSIAHKAGIELSRLLADNRISDSSVLRVGQVLSVRGKSTDTAIAQNTGTTITASDAMTTTTIAEKAVAQAGIQASDLSGKVTSGTSFQTTAYTEGSKLTWPHPGERFAMNGKLPGILIKANKGDPVKSVTSGKVVYSGPHATFGHIVFVQSPEGFIYIYGGNESSPLKTGDSVQVGDIIGTVGVTPGILEPQVYFSIWKDGTYIDPSSVLKG